MIRTSSIAATLLMLMSTASSFAASTQPLGPSQTGPVVTRDQGEVASPGDPFYPRRSQPSADTPPAEAPSPDAPKFEAECRFSDREGNFVTVTYVNTGDETIPAGTWLIASNDANGNGVTTTLENDLKPGESISVKVNVNNSPHQYEGELCDVWLYAGTGPLPTHPL